MGYSFIPQLQETITYICFKLDEIERQEYLSLQKRKS
ncbi:MAG: V-type ATP synthase subunit D [bacterium]